MREGRKEEKGEREKERKKERKKEREEKISCGMKKWTRWLVSKESFVRFSSCRS